MDIIGRIKEIASDAEFHKDVVGFLIDICGIDTTPNPDIEIMRKNEKRVFDAIKTRLNGFSFNNSKIIEKNISAEIERHPAFTKLHFTKTPSRPEGLSADETYRNRYNLLYFIDNEFSEMGNNVALDVHIDVVAPFFPPRIEKDYIYGRGTADDKGNVAVIYGALAIIDKLAKKKAIHLKNKITAMFVVEEETGGNGSLALALDKELKKRYDAVLVLEVAGNNIYSANRGAVWFKCAADWKDQDERVETVLKPSLLEGMIFSVLEMQIEGDKIKSESNHPLFPHRPVQTCNGILGAFGEHPSRICGEVSFVLEGIRNDDEFTKIKETIRAGIKEYIGKYGDKTETVDPVTGRKKVDRHIDIKEEANSGFLVIEVHGSTGHMGSLIENDAAITKWAYIAKKIFELKLNEGFDFTMELKDFDSSRLLVLEGGQGFLPTHKIEEIQKRMRDAFARGAKKYLDLIGAEGDMIRTSVTYDKLHNDAFDGCSNSPAMKKAWASGIDAGTICKDTPIRGWDVSCDARLFAAEYPGMPVITAGVGELKSAHADNENVYLPDLFKAITFTVLFLLRQTGSIEC